MKKYKKCFVPTCNNDSENSSKTIVRIREDLREKWCREVNVEYHKVYTQHCCEDHFDPEQALANVYFKSANQEPRFKSTAKLQNIGINLQGEVSCGLQIDEPKSELEKILLHPTPESRKRKYEEIDMPSTSGVLQSKPSKAKTLEELSSAGLSKTPPVSPAQTEDSEESTEEQDPLSFTNLVQCRFCGDFTKNCLPVSPNYLADNIATLAFKNTTVKLNFNDESKPKTVCEDCDSKLRLMQDFVQLVDNAQNNLSNVEAATEENQEIDIKIEFEEVEYLNEDETGDDEITPDVLPKTETKKRKTDTVNVKKAKVTKVKSEKVFNESIDTKEEGIGRQRTSDIGGASKVISDTGTKVRGKEENRAKIVLVYGRDSNS